MSRPPAILYMGDLVIVARQLAFITEARRRGLEPLLVITPDTDAATFAACRADPAHPLSQLADVVLVDDATVEHVVPAIQPWLRRYDVRGVLCIGDFFVEPVGLVADILGLPGATAKTSRICRNKLLQRTAAPNLAPAFEVVPPAARGTVRPNTFRYPVVVKPVSLFSSLGVRQVHDPGGLARELATYQPARETLLVESRVVGPEFSVEALAQGGEVFWAQVTAKETNESSGVFFTEMGHTTPADLAPADQQALLDANVEVIRRIGFQDGMTHAEFRLAGDRAVLMEIACRLPGDGLTFLWHLATGAPLEPVLLDLALGVRTSYPEPRRRAVQVYLEHPHGRLRDVVSEGPPVSWVERDSRWPAFTPLPPDAPPTAHAVLVTKVPGDVLGPQTDSTARSASVIFDLPLDEPVEEHAKAFAAQVSVLVDA